MSIESNNAISGLPGFGVNFGNTEARLALAIAAAGGSGSSGGGSGLSQANVEDAVEAALNGLANWHTVKRTAVALTTSTGWAIGDAAEFVFSGPLNNPGLISAATWNNLSAKTSNLIAPTDYIWLDTIEYSCNSLRLVNQTGAAQLIKTSNAFLNTIYIDNLAAGVIYLQIFDNLTATPTPGALPLESYRCPSNGSISFKLSKAYAGQLWLAISTTPGIFTPSANPKNLVIKYL